MTPFFRIIFIFLFSLPFFSCENEEEWKVYEVRSPDQNLHLKVLLTDAGEPAYLLERSGKVLLDTSRLGMTFQQGGFLGKNLQILNVQVHHHDETWESLWGEEKLIRNAYQDLQVDLKESSEQPREFSLNFRLFNDGLAFRYTFPEQENLGPEVVITEEHSHFQLASDPECWWIPGDWDIYEHLYSKTRFSEIDASSMVNHKKLAQTYIPDVHAVNTPVTLRTDEGLHLSFHEAALTDYAGMTLHADREGLNFRSALVAWPNGDKVRTQTPFVSPWRTVQVSPTAAGLIDSRMILNLNEPSQIEDTDWIRPTKYMGIWWEMHIDKATWDRASGRHGATTANAKRYIDFAAAHKIPALLVEGWNTGWEHWIGFEDREGVFDFVTPYPDFDIQEVVRYGKEKGVSLVGHHETSAATQTYEKQLDTAFAFYRDLGITTVKTGYVGTILPQGQYHHGQYMVRHYRKVLETAAQYKIMIDAHEPIKPTGIRRTWPNMMSREGLRGQEFNAWSEGNGPDHTVIFPFTRGLAGPVDFTPGIFSLSLDPWKPDNRVPTTLAKQLALYVTIYSPLQMAADLPENYEGHPAFAFIEEVGVDWDESHCLLAEIGEYLVMARKERGTGRWFIGGISNAEARDLEIPLDLLGKGPHTLQLFRDAADADWQDNPTAIEIEEISIPAGEKLKVHFAPGGGFAAIVR